MLSERLKKRLTRNRSMTTITLRIPVDALESIQEISHKKGFSEYQTLLKSYISDGLRRDEAQYASSLSTRLINALRQHGVSEMVLAAAEREMSIDI